jgi:hypothetical protein
MALELGVWLIYRDMDALHSRIHSQSLGPPRGRKWTRALSAASLPLCDEWVLGGASPTAASSPSGSFSPFHHSTSDLQSLGGVTSL